MKLVYNPSTYFFSCLCKKWQTDCKLALQAVQRYRACCTRFPCVPSALEGTKQSVRLILEPDTGGTFLVRLEEFRMIEERYDSLFPNGSLNCWIKPARFWRTDVVFGCRLGSRFTSGGSWSGSPACIGTTPSGYVARALFTVRATSAGARCDLPAAD
jgi:hypothetical protein